jgi:hypothetical protein
MKPGNVLIETVLTELRQHRDKMRAMGYDLDGYDRGYAAGEIGAIYLHVGADLEVFKAANAEIRSMTPQPEASPC